MESEIGMGQAMGGEGVKFFELEATDWSHVLDSHSLHVARVISGPGEDARFVLWTACYGSDPAVAQRPCGWPVSGNASFMAQTSFERRSGP